MKEQVQDFLSGAPFYGEGTFAQVLFWIAEDYRATEFPHETLAEAHLYQYSQVPELCALWSPFGGASVQDIFYRAEWEDCVVYVGPVVERNGIPKCLPKQPEIRALFEYLLTLGI